MNRFWRIAGLVACAAATAVVLTAAVFALGGSATLGYAGLLLLLIVTAFYAWMLFAFLHYRQCRREEFLQVLAAAAEANAPLAPALWAYLRDRPRGTLRELWIGLLLLFVLPGIYWLWYRPSNYDRKVERVARLLEDGYPLPDALRLTPGVASRETLLAATLGQDTGQLGRCLRALRSPARDRLAMLWLEMVPRFAYPLLLLVVINGVLLFWTIFISPRYERMFSDFSMALPPEMQVDLVLGNLALNYGWLLMWAVPLCAALLVLLLVSPSVRWYFPLVGRLYRAHVGTQILQGLAFLLQMGQPAPEALGVLAESGCFVGGARRRLEDAGRRVERGEPLAESLWRARILPRSAVPLLHTAERVGNVPWALAELGDVLASRSARRVQRVGMALSPLPVVGVGVLVGLIVLGLFMPLIALVEGLAP